jgi:hypothetical protein
MLKCNEDGFCDAVYLSHKVIRIYEYNPRRCIEAVKIDASTLSPGEKEVILWIRRTPF